jgi:protease-4
VDAFGGLYDAILIAADRAGVSEDFRVYEYAEITNPFQMMMQAFGSSARSSMEDELGDVFMEYKHLRETLSEQGVQARMPYVVKIN